MSNSDDSDYNVEDYIKPEITRHTYGKTDDSYLSEEGDFNESNENDEDEISDSELPSTKTKELNLTLNEIKDYKEEEMEKKNEPIRTNNRFILYVSNLPPDTTKQMLEALFMDCGQLKSVRIPKKRLGNFAFVEMSDIEGFKNGLKLDGKEMGEKNIRVYQGSKNKKHISNKSKIQKRKKYEIIQNKIKKKIKAF